jgi:sec-independent protein translocase protein TatC
VATVESARLGEDDVPRRDRRMSLAQHLTELRRRFIIGIIALVVGMIIAWIFTDAIIWAMTEPIRVVAAQRGDGDVVTLMYQSITGPFDMRLRIALAVGVIFSAPVWVWQIWAFLVPGLTGRRSATPSGS